VYQHFDPPRQSLYLDGRLLRLEAETGLQHKLPKERLPPAPGICYERLPVRGQQQRHETSESPRAALLVEYVGREDEAESPEVCRAWCAPVERGSLRRAPQVLPGVVPGEIEGGLVVVGGEDVGTTVHRRDGRKPDAASKLDGVTALQVLAREETGQGRGARPQLGPVGEPVVLVELPLVYKGIGDGRVGEAVALIPDFDDGFC